MRQTAYEHPLFRPGRFLHVRKPGFISWNVEPQFVRPGFLGVPPIMDVARQLPRQVHYPMLAHAYPDTNTRQQEYMQVLEPPRPQEYMQVFEPPPLTENFLQMAWLKGIKRDKKMSSSWKSTNGLRKRKSCFKEAGAKSDLSKVANKGGNAVESDALQKDVVGSLILEETMEKLPASERDELLPSDEVASDEQRAHESQVGVEKQGKPLFEEIEEGEIVSSSPERNHDVDKNETFDQVDTLDTLHTVEKRTSDIPLGGIRLLLSLEISKDRKLDAMGLNLSNYVGSGVKSNLTLDETSPNATTTPPSDSSMSSESLEASTANIIVDTCENMAENSSVAQTNGPVSTQPILPSLSEIPEVVENGKGCLKSRDPRKRSNTICLSDLGNPQHMALSKGSIREKRKHGQADLPETPSKRFCIQKENVCQDVLDDQLRGGILIQEPIDMEIDSPIARVPDTTHTQENIDNSPEPIAPVLDTTRPSAYIDNQGDENSQTKPTSLLLPLTVTCPSKLRLRSRDPRRALVHRSKSDRGFSSAKNMPGSGGVSDCKEEIPCDLSLKQECLGSYAPRSGEDPWGNMHLEGLTDREREAIHVERARRIDEQNCMLNSKKLCLVLDLDHTLLNSAKFSEVDENLKGVLCEMETGGRRTADGQPAKKDLFRYPKLGMWTKLRPGVWNFLSRASELFELHVYTMGNKAYATEMAKLLDPTGTLFAGRVISRGDDSERTINSDPLPKSKDLDGVLGLESAVIIIDDSAHVWPHHRHNLLVVERYMYFPSSRRQFGLSGPSLLEIRHDERAADGMLASVLKVIEKIHHSFFSNKSLHEVDVRHVLMTVKQSVLAGCKILFSRVYPQGESQPHLHPLWQTAEQFGAVCTTTIDDEVTHVVALSQGTEKVKWAMRTGRFSVCPAWLEASAVLYRHASEVDFPVPP